MTMLPEEEAGTNSIEVTFTRCPKLVESRTKAWVIKNNFVRNISVSRMIDGILFHVLH